MHVVIINVLNKISIDSFYNYFKETNSFHEDIPNFEQCCVDNYRDINCEITLSEIKSATNKVQSSKTSRVR